jgi:hypothetical protein
MKTLMQSENFFSSRLDCGSSLITGNGHFKYGKIITWITLQRERTLENVRRKMWRIRFGRDFGCVV